MPNVTLKTIQTSDDELRRIQANVSDALNLVQQGPFFGGVTLLNVPLANGNTVIAHKLSRVPQLWIQFDKTIAASSVYRVSWNNSTITLNSSAACIVTLWVN